MRDPTDLGGLLLFINIKFHFLDLRIVFHPMISTTVSYHRKFNLGVVLTFITALSLIVVSFVIGKNDFFLLLNVDLGSLFDYFFRFWTNLGDGIVWVMVAILFFIYHKNKFPLLMATILLSTLFTQFTKHFIFPETLRPTAAIANLQLIHTVPGVELLSANSFPSGHTATVFSIFLLACLLIKKNWVVPIGFLCALLVGYSRIYLAQHFPLDVGGGMLAAVFAVLISLAFQKRWEEKNQPRST